METIYNCKYNKNVRKAFEKWDTKALDFVVETLIRENHLRTAAHTRLHQRAGEQ